MSREYRPILAIPFAEITQARLEKYGVFVDDVRERCGVLVNGVFVYIDSEAETKRLYGSDGVCLFAISQDGDKDVIFQHSGLTPIPWFVINAIAQEFATEVVDEDDPRFWGGDTWEEVYRRP